MFKQAPPDAERCMAFTASRNRAGERCPNRRTEGVLCTAHARWGAVAPDHWTQPDNLPVVYAHPELAR